MKIERIESYRRDDHLLAVHVTTDDGVVGVGQASVFRAGITQRVLHDMVAPMFLGRDPWDLEAIVHATVREHYKFEGSFVTRALCGVDTAIWDILGKTAGVPVYRLLGGRLRDEIPVYASSIRRDISPEDESERLGTLISELGFTGVKIRIGREMGMSTDQWPGRTETLIRTVRETLGEDVIIHADANGGYDTADAIRIGRLLEEYNYGHFEEPTPYTETDSMAAIADALDIPVAAGEHDTSLDQIGRSIRRGAVAIIQPDIGYLGGVSRARKVAGMAEAQRIPCTPPCSSQSMIQVFTLHLAASAPAAYQLQEWSIESQRLFEGMYAPMPVVRNGVVQVGTAPGWGVELEKTFMERADREVSTA